MMATKSGSELKKRINISIDNDLEQIPGYLLNPSKWEDGVKAISEAEGDLKFYKTLVNSPS